MKTTIHSSKITAIFTSLFDFNVVYRGILIRALPW